jgi:hypothetical protein
MKTVKFPKNLDEQTTMASAPATYARLTWERLSPAERLRRSWQLRRRLPSLQRVHDAKLLPGA